MGLFPSQNRTILIHIWFHIMYPFLFQYQCLTDGQMARQDHCLLLNDQRTAMRREPQELRLWSLEVWPRRPRPCWMRDSQNPSIHQYFLCILQNRLFVLFHGLLLFTLYQVSCSFLLTLNELPREILKLWSRVTRASKLHQELATNCTLAEKHRGCNFPVNFCWLINLCDLDL